MANNATVRINLVDEFSSAARRIQSRTDGMSRSFQQMSKNTQAVTERMNQLGKSAQSVGKRLTARLTLPIAAIGGTMLKSSSSFETAMLRVKSISLSTEEDFNSLRESARKMGSESVFSAVEAAEAQAFLAQAGFDTQQIIGSLPAVLDLAAAAQLDVARAGDIASNIMGVFNIKAEETTKIADLLSLASAKSNVNVQMLGDSFRFVGPEAQAMGLSLAQVTAMLGQLGNAGIQGGMAGTSLRRAFQTLQNPTKEVQSLFNSVGVQVRDSSGEMRNFIDIMADMKEVGVTDLFVTKAFGSISAGPVRIMLQNLDEMNGLLNELEENSDGVAKSMSTINVGGLGGALRLLQSALQELSIEFFDKETLTFLRESVEKVRDVVVGFTKQLSPAAKKIILLVGGIAFVAGPLLFVLGKALVIAGVIAALKIPAIIFTVAKVFLGITAALTGGAISAGMFSGSLTKMLEKMSDMPIISQFIKIMKSLWTVLKAVGGLFKDVGGVFINSLISAFTRLANTEVGQKFFKFINDEVRITIELIDRLLGMIPSIVSSFGGLIQDISVRAVAKMQDDGPLSTTGLAPISLSSSGVPILPPAAMAQANGNVSGKIIVETKDNAGVISSVKTEASGDVSLDTGNNMRGINS